MSPLYEFLLRMGDNTLVLGHRVSEWCGHAPVLEEDIALANTALDLIGQTQMWLGYAADLDPQGRTADDLAMLRDVAGFRCALLVEQPNGDFGQTMVRQFLFDAWHFEMLGHLSNSTDARIAGIASKALKEVTYHLERATDTVIGLGDGTELSHAKMQAALDLLWPYVGELFESDTGDASLAAEGVIPMVADLRPAFDARLRDVLDRATLQIPGTDFAHSGGRSGKMHSEHLGHLLSSMQWLQRAYPGAQW